MPTAVSEVASAFTEGASALATSLGTMVGDVVPALLPVLGIVIAIAFGRRIYKTLTH